MERSASETVKVSGFKSMKELSELTGKDRQTLNRWYNEQPAFFGIVMIGALAVKHKVTAYNFDFKRKRAKDLDLDSYAELLRYVKNAEDSLEEASAELAQLRINIRRDSF